MLRCENHGQTRYAAGTAVHSPYAGFGTWPPAGVSGLFARLLTFYDLFSVKSLVGHRDLISSVDGYWTARHVMQALSLSAITAQLLVVSRIFRKMVCCLPSEWCVATSFYQRAANHVSFIFAKLILPYPTVDRTSPPICRPQANESAPWRHFHSAPSFTAFLSPRENPDSGRRCPGRHPQRRSAAPCAATKPCCTAPAPGAASGSPESSSLPTR